MKYPTTVIDNFLPDPDEIVRFMHRCAFEENHPSYPGTRTRHIHLLDQKLHDHLDCKICSLFQIDKSPNLSSCYFFQKIKPRFPKWDPRDCGMVHIDSPCEMGGVIYLDPDPDPDAGTSTYVKRIIGQDKNAKVNAHPDNFHKGYGMSQEDNQLWWDLHAGLDIDVDKYNEIYHRYTDQFEESVTVKNKYNRLILFDGTTWHRCPTHGDRTRHTIVFFFGDAALSPERHKSAPPLHRFL